MVNILRVYFGPKWSPNNIAFFIFFIWKAKSLCWICIKGDKACGMLKCVKVEDHERTNPCCPPGMGSSGLGSVQSECLAIFFLRRWGVKWENLWNKKNLNQLCWLNNTRGFPLHPILSIPTLRATAPRRSSFSVSILANPSSLTCSKMAFMDLLGDESVMPERRLWKYYLNIDIHNDSVVDLKKKNELRKRWDGGGGEKTSKSHFIKIEVLYWKSFHQTRRMWLDALR